VLLNYCRFKTAVSASDWVCELVDCLSGENHSVHARAVVNATGPWADGLPHSRVKLRLTKGVHLVVERTRLPVPETVVMTEGKRILFAIPWGERTILGTTDTDYSGSLEDVRAESSDLAYVLQVTNQHFPSARLTRADVISAWAGLRPLIANRSGKPSDISRSHQIRTPEPGWWDVAGGKLTTYRLMAEQTVDRISDWVKHTPGFDRMPKPCSTASEPLVPGNEAGKFSGIVPPEVSRSAVEHFVSKEWAVHLEDVMVRRTSWHYYHRNAAAIAERVADWMAESLGWPAEVRHRELEQYFAAHQLPRENAPVNNAVAIAS
jgi:glycerol-3-phosphate dehydrogenase